MENNRLFKGGDLFWDGMIIKEIHRCMTNWTCRSPTRAPAAPSRSVRVPLRRAGGRRGLCEALGPRPQDFDYGDKHGVAIEAIYGIGKMQFGSRHQPTPAT